jgi:hypothetical protein
MWIPKLVSTCSLVIHVFHHANQCIYFCWSSSSPSKLGYYCRGSINRSAICIGAWRFVEGVNTRTGVARVYPALTPATSVAIIHYNGNKCSVTMMVLNLASRAPPHWLIKAPGVGITAVPGWIQHRVLD